MATEWLGAARRTRDISGRVPPIVPVFGAILSLQLGSAIAKHLFPVVGASGTVALRICFGALVLLVAWRPRVRGYTKANYGVALAFGLTTVAMNLSFYNALARLPLGVAVTLEFIGPLGVAVAGSRKLRDLLWVILAAAGITLLSPLGKGGTRLDPLGIAFALGAACFWAGYILLNARVGGMFPGGAGLTLAMGAAALVLLPVAARTLGPVFHAPTLLAMGIGIAALSCALPYSLEFAALRRLPTEVFGVLMSIEPVVAALIGFALLGERLTARALAAIICITIAAVGASWRKGNARRSDQGAL